MPPTESVDCVPVLLTHWDPDMYSSDALPLIPELVIQILVHGEVWLKEVDLFLTATIQEQFDREEQFEQFSSLVETGRVKVLIPDESYKLIDPGTQPLLATAIERELSKRPLATAEWRLTNSVRRYCERLDRVLVRADAIRRRQLPPNENVFAETLSRVLSLPEVTWHGSADSRGSTTRSARRLGVFARTIGMQLHFSWKGTKSRGVMVFEAWPTNAPIVSRNSTTDEKPNTVRLCGLRARERRCGGNFCWRKDRRNSTDIVIAGYC